MLRRDDTGGFWYIFFAIFPSNLLAIGLNHLGQASATAESPGLRWEQRDSFCVDWPNDHPDEPWPTADPDVYMDYTCVMSLGRVFEILAVQSVLYPFIAFYLDNIFKNENGVRRPPWYLLQRGYWSPPHHGVSIRTGSSRRAPPLDEPSEPDSDVQDEAQRMRELFRGRTGVDVDDPNTARTAARVSAAGAVASEHGDRLALEVYGLRKWFTKSAKCSTCHFQAVKNSWFAVDEGQLFCLLGPNGEGLCDYRPPEVSGCTGTQGLMCRSRLGKARRCCMAMQTLWPQKTAVQLSGR